MDPSSRTVETPPGPVVEGASASAMTVRDPRVFGPDFDELVHLFLRRIFTVSGVRAVVVDRAGASAVIRLDPGAGLAARLVEALRGVVEPLGRDVAPRPPFGSTAAWTVHRLGDVLTTLNVASDDPNRLRLRLSDEARGGSRLVEIEAELSSLPGVTDARFHWWSNCLVIQYEPATIARLDLIRRAEAVIVGTGRPFAHDLPAPAAVRFGAVNAALVVAVAGEVLFPLLDPLSALMLLATNVTTFQEAAGQVKRGELGLPVLYTTIVATTLATGQFVAPALMTWMFRYWRGRSQTDLHRERLRLAEGLKSTAPPKARLMDENGAEAAVDASRLCIGDRVAVAAGETVPADGRVVSGAALVDERGLVWGGGVLSRRPGDAVQAGSLVLTGLLSLSVERTGRATRAAAIGRALEAATRPDQPSASSHPRIGRFAGRSVGPTLATAGVGLFVGGFATAGAILRPDYATGPGVAGPLETLRGLEQGLSRGVLVRDPSAFVRLPECGMIALDDHPALRRRGLDLALIQSPLSETDDVLRYAASAARHLGDDRALALAEACRARAIPLLRLDAEEVAEGVIVRHGSRHVRLYGLAADGDPTAPLGLEINGAFVGLLRFRPSRRPAAADALVRLRARTNAPIVLLSDSPARETADLAEALGIDRHIGGLSTEDRARFLLDCTRRGLRPAWLGDACAAERLAPVCHVAIAHGEDADLDTCTAAALLLSTSLEPLADLWEIAASHAERLKSAERLVLLPNLFCVAGVFTLGFTSLTAVFLSNLGTYGAYSLASGSLRDSRRLARPSRSATHHIPRPRQGGGLSHVATSA